jgi:hypothetical protein
MIVFGHFQLGLDRAEATFHKGVVGAVLVQREMEFLLLCVSGFKGR